VGREEARQARRTSGLRSITRRLTGKRIWGGGSSRVLSPLYFGRAQRSRKRQKLLQPTIRPARVRSKPRAITRRSGRRPSGRRVVPGGQLAERDPHVVTVGVEDEPDPVDRKGIQGLRARVQRTVAGEARIRT